MSLELAMKARSLKIAEEHLQMLEREALELKSEIAAGALDGLPTGALKLMLAANTAERVEARADVACAAVGVSFLRETAPA